MITNQDLLLSAGLAIIMVVASYALSSKDMQRKLTEDSDIIAAGAVFLFALYGFIVTTLAFIKAIIPNL